MSNNFHSHQTSEEITDIERKFDREVFEVTHNNKKKDFTNLISLNLWLKNYFFSKPKI